MKTVRLLGIVLCLALFRTSVCAQAAQGDSQALSALSSRLRLFGERIPQEKVFVHMDNTCYFLGDTIWFAAYTRQTNTDKPSKISRVLYAELWNNDGYLVERKLIEMKEGSGHGCFALSDSLYGGFYELRAYTRWQLNWGITEKSHTTYAEDWFYNKAMAKEFYRDYDKLYSRVFPVYDKPQTPGEFHHDMTMRPKRRYFRDAGEAPTLQLSLFPEGGNLVAGIPCRVAFEAATSEGEALEGTLQHSIAAVSRGRGLFTLTPQAGEEYTFTFTATDGRTVTAKLPQAETDGVALSVVRQDDEWVISVAAQGLAAQRPLGLTIMHEGKVEWFEEIKEKRFEIKDLPAGVHQAIVFDAEGRVWADRLFFVTKPELLEPTLTVSGLKEQYEPFEQIELDINGKSGEARLSLAIRDAFKQDYTYDSGNILTEMLLSSEIKGFVPQPEYFFEKDDEEHRRALDLLMMTQGWRRFNWREMAVKGAWEITQPAENPTQVLRGTVYNYEPAGWQDDVSPPVCEMPEIVREFGVEFMVGSRFMYVPTPYAMESFLTKKITDGDIFRKAIMTATEGDSLSTYLNYLGLKQGEVIETIIAQTYDNENNSPAGSYRMRNNIASFRFAGKSSTLKNDVLVHAEFAQPGNKPLQGDVTTDNGHFKIQAPYFNEECLLYLAASDSTRWKKGKPHTWIEMDEKAEAESYVRLEPFYPRFTKPYHYAQTHYRSVPAKDSLQSQFNSTLFETGMQAITIRARHSGQRRFDASKPAYVVDAYQAFNDICDAGLSAAWYGGRIHFINGIARCYLGDMNTYNAYLLQPRYDDRNVSFSFRNYQIDSYNQLSNLDKVKIYTDFCPRYDDNTRITEDNVENAVVNLQLLPNAGQRTTYRDRRYVLQGFSIAEDYYHPDYQRNPPTEGKKDYRRTLYWNPDLQLDANGQAHITLYNNSQKTQICIEANGQAPDGALLQSGMVVK